jgi:hypothetical protein
MVLNQPEVVRASLRALGPNKTRVKPTNNRENSRTEQNCLFLRRNSLISLNVIQKVIVFRQNSGVKYKFIRKCLAHRMDLLQVFVENKGA